MVHSAAATAPAIAALIAPTHDTLPPSAFFGGQRIYTGARCDADMFEIPGLKRRPVRIGGATGKLWDPSTRRSAGGRVEEFDSTHIVLIQA